MKWSWRIGSFAGIGVYIHATFLLLLVFVAMSHWRQGPQAMLSGILFITALFACVLAHEFGHSLTARKFGVQTREITLLPIGGVARLEKMPEEPSQELWVALAGPAVNVVIAGILFAILQATSSFQPVDNLTVTGGSFIERLAIVNLFIALFNMIPAFPMDGGRVLRAILASRMDYTQATQLASSTGQVIAFALGLFGLLMFNPFLIFIALFVFIGAAQEASMVQMKSALGGIPVSRAMLTEFHTLAPNDTLSTVAERIIQGSQHDFPVVFNGEVQGIVLLGDIISALSQKGADVYVTEVMRRNVEPIHPNDMLESTLQKLQASGLSIAPVTKDGNLVGLLTTENVGEFMMIQAAYNAPKPNLGRQL